MEYLLMFFLIVTAIFLIMLVLVQRGRGGGLAGAFGGAGGQSAFGTKAGDLFTRITIVVAAFWIVLCAASVKLLSSGENRVSKGMGANSTVEEKDQTKPGEKSGTKASPARPTTKSSPAGTAPAGKGPASTSGSGNGASRPPAGSTRSTAPSKTNTPAERE